MSVKKMRSVYKEVVGATNPKYMIENNTDVPPLTRYSVLIEVKACALSFVDIKLPRGSSRGGVGNDVAGIVREVGSAVTSLRPGDHIVGIVPLDCGYSGCAEYIVLHEFDVTRKPEGVSWVDAAGCIGDAVRAYTALHYLGRLSHGDSMLVMDGASAFGALCVQLAHHWGAKVITTVSSEDERLYVEGSLGEQVSLVIDQRNTTQGQRFRNDGSGSSERIWAACLEETGGLGVDLIVDNGRNLVSTDSNDGANNGNYAYPTLPRHEIISALAVGGRWITSKPNLQLDPPNSRLLFLKCASLGFLFEHAWTLSSAQQGQYLHILMDIMEKVDDGVIRPNVYHTVSLDSVPEAMRKLPSVRVGKVVMRMED